MLARSAEPASSCPRCGHPDGRHDALASMWVCPGCGAALRPSRVHAALWGGLALLGIALHLTAMRRGWAWFDLGGLIMTFCGLAVFLLRVRTVVVTEGPCCPACLYDLSKLPAGTPCPECGTTTRRARTP